MPLQPPWDSPSRGDFSRNWLPGLKPILTVSMWLEVNVHLVLSNKASLPFDQLAPSFFEGQHYFPVPFQLPLLRTMCPVLLEQSVDSWLPLPGL